MKEDKNNCVFCKILEGKLESSIVYEDDLAVALMDIQPINPGHILVIPRQHLSYIAELNEELGAHLFKIGMRINNALRKSDLKCEGVDYFLADGEAAGQEVFHSHLHVFPRFENDGFGFRFNSNYTKLPARSELDLIAEKIRRIIEV